VLAAFLLVFSALFSIVNPPGSALIFSQITEGRSPVERAMLARQIGFYSAIIMLVALWCGAWVLGFFGISLPALRIAGGAVVAASAWRLLFMTDRYETGKQRQAAESLGSASVAFFPLTMPFTAGPGTISVAVAIGANAPHDRADLLSFAIGASAAALAVAGSVWLFYASADRLLSRLGPGGTRILSRLSAFLLLCIGTQIALTGLGDFVRDLWPPPA
jgi:multiple antibiotic resistance protein